MVSRSSHLTLANANTTTGLIFMPTGRILVEAEQVGR